MNNQLLQKPAQSILTGEIALAKAADYPGVFVPFKQTNYIGK